MGHFFIIIIIIFLKIFFLLQTFSGRFDTSRSMIPRLVPEISPCDGFYDGVAVAVASGIGYSSRLIQNLKKSKSMLQPHHSDPMN